MGLGFEDVRGVVSGERMIDCSSARAVAGAKPTTTAGRTMEANGRIMTLPIYRATPNVGQSAQFLLINPGRAAWTAAPEALPESVQSFPKKPAVRTLPAPSAS